MKAITNINLPRLRFPEFSGGWEKKKLGEVTTWKSGGTPPKENNEFWGGNVPWISGSSMKGNEYFDSEVKLTELGVKNGSKISTKGSLLLLVRGSMLFNKIPVGIALRDLAFNQDVKSITPISTLESKYVLYWFISKENVLMDLVSGTGIGAGKLDISDLQAQKFIYPSLPEQQKIASFLSAVDEKLQALKKKKSLLERYKKGVMQKIFSLELRFKADGGNDFPEWEVKKLGDCLDYIQPTKYLVESTEYDNSYSTPVLTAGKTFILGYTNETKGIFEDNLPVIIFDDFTTATQFVDFPFKAKSSAMKILVAKENVSIKFIYETMQILKYEIGGHERHWISKFTLLDISLPSLEEQTKIANFLSAIDEKIHQVQGQIEKMEVWKKGLLQKMFV